MASSFNSLGLFNSGPHRFRLGAEGEYALVLARIDPFQAGSTPVGPLELVVIVRGRLQASSQSALWMIRDTITAQLTHPPQIGALVDHSGRTWDDVSFTRFEVDDRIDRGRIWSVGYEATFTRFLKK